MTAVREKVDKINGILYERGMFFVLDQINDRWVLATYMYSIWQWQKEINWSKKVIIEKVMRLFSDCMNSLQNYELDVVAQNFHESYQQYAHKTFPKQTLAIIYI